MKKNAEKWYERFGTVSAVLLVVSTILLGIYWGFQEFSERHVAHSLLVFLAKEVGMAGLIALILNLSIEWINRARHAAHQDALLLELDEKYQSTSRRLLKNVNKQIFKTLYKRNIDPDVFSQVDEHLLKAKIMRRDFVVTVTLTPLEGENGESQKFAKMVFENTFRVCNLTNKSVVEPVVKALVERIPRYQEHCRFVRVSIGDTEYLPEKLEELADKLTDRSLLKLIINHEILPEDSIPISLYLEKVVPIDHVDIITTTIPMDQIRLRVVDPLGYFKIDALSMHPVDEKRVSQPGEQILTEWYIDKSILPGQGIMIFWHPRIKQDEPFDESLPLTDEENPILKVEDSVASVAKAIESLGFTSVEPAGT